MLPCWWQCRASSGCSRSGWRWTFWLILVALLFGVLRVPVAVLQLTGVLAADTPTWYVLYQGLLGMAQFGIGLVMVVGYRHAGSWGSS